MPEQLRVIAEVHILSSMLVLLMLEVVVSVLIRTITGSTVQKTNAV